MTIIQQAKFKLFKKAGNGLFFKGKAMSDSMAPLIEKGDEVIFKKVSFDSLNRKDIIVFFKDTSKQLVAHRIKKVLEGKGIIFTQGDNRGEQDSFILTAENFLGKAIFLIKDNHKLPLDGWLSRLFAFGFISRFDCLNRLLPLQKLEYRAKKKLKEFLFKIY